MAFYILLNFLFVKQMIRVRSEPGSAAKATKSGAHLIL